jgi:hypothetical protein
MTMIFPAILMCCCMSAVLMAISGITRDTTFGDIGLGFLAAAFVILFLGAMYVLASRNIP